MTHANWTVVGGRWLPKVPACRSPATTGGRDLAHGCCRRRKQWVRVGTSGDSRLCLPSTISVKRRRGSASHNVAAACARLDSWTAVWFLTIKEPLSRRTRAGSVPLDSGLLLSLSFVFAPLSLSTVYEVTLHPRTDIASVRGCKELGLNQRCITPTRVTAFIIMGSSEAAMLPVKNQVLLGTFVHSKTAQELDYMHNTAVAVDSHGTIVGIERDAADVMSAKAKLLANLGWSESDVQVCVSKEGQFFFPGFIGESRSTAQGHNFIYDPMMLIGGTCRHPCPCAPVCKRGHLRQVVSA